MTVSMFGPDEAIQRALDAVEEPVEVRVESVGGLAATNPAVETRLTDRQREVVESALSLGYYDVPRTASHEDVAADVDCAPSTASEHLRKAESTVLSSLFGR